MKKIQPEASDMGSVTRPRMMPHDNNRDPFSPPQNVNKVYQQYRGAQQNPPGYGEGMTVPFNIGGEYHY